LRSGFRATSEYVRVHSDAVNGWDRWAAYAALSRRQGAWTPYAYYARMQSAGRVLRLYGAVVGNQVSIPNPAIATSQRLVADSLLAHISRRWPSAPPID
jgi:hypothetical protein